MITKKIKKFKHFWQENFQKKFKWEKKKKDINLDRNKHYSIYL